LAPWLSRFALASRPAAARSSAKALAPLLKISLEAYLPLLDCAKATDLLRTNGALHLFRTEKNFRASAWDIAVRQAENIPQKVLDEADISALEPDLAIRFERAIFYPQAAHIADPGALIRRLADAVIAHGGAICRDEIHSLNSNDQMVRLSGGAVDIRAKMVVIAAGAWSKGLARQAGDHIPLETERGYHVEFAHDRPPLSRPVCPIELGFYLTPMAGRLRAAGTVELSNLRHPVNSRRLELLERGARAVLPNLGQSGSKWLGFRPSLPDSLPVIGRSVKSPNVVYAFGHGHLGLTLAAATARFVSQIVGGEMPPLAAPFSPLRF
jgi:D-amino-acid dehydrogenase